MFTYAEIHGIRINHSDPQQALEELNELVSRKPGHFVCFIEANLFSRSQKEPEVRKAVNAAVLIYPDGIACARDASVCSGIPFQRVSGPSILLKACEYGISKNWRHFFLGGGEGVADRLAENLKRRFPGIQIAGTCCPPFRPLTDAEETEIKEMIESAHTDLLWVGLGGPKQEFWMAAHQGRIQVPVMLGVGAAFDFHSGNRPWAPEIVRSTGTEWLWRMLTGGKKTFLRNVKCVTHIAFVLMKDMIRYKIFHAHKAALRKS